MNQVKRIAGVLWILLALAAAVKSVYTEAGLEDAVCPTMIENFANNEFAAMEAIES